MVQRGMLNVPIIRTRHKINTVDNSILLCLLNMSEFVSSSMSNSPENHQNKMSSLSKPAHSDEMPNWI